MKFTFNITNANVLKQMEKMTELEEIVKELGKDKSLEDAIKTTTAVTASTSIGGNMKIAYNYKDYLDGVKIYFIFGFYGITIIRSDGWYSFVDFYSDASYQHDTDIKYDGMLLRGYLVTVELN